MARLNVKGTRQIGAECDAELVIAFRQFCKGRGESVRRHLEWAMRQHLEQPPGPLVAVVVEQPAPPTGPPRKKKPT